MWEELGSLGRNNGKEYFWLILEKTNMVSQKWNRLLPESMSFTEAVHGKYK